MINNYGQIASTYASTQTSVQPKSSGASSSEDILSSFKEILTTMMSSSMSSSQGQGSSGISDMMAPLMLMLLEKMMEQQLGNSSSTTETTQADKTISQGPKPVPSGRPISGGTLTQEFHTGHIGLDFGIPVGSSVKTTMDGKVIHAGWNNEGYGNLVIVENGAYRTYYAHLSSIPVSVGDSVSAGTTIGLSGNTGNSTGPHLHYEIRKNMAPIDPAPTTLNNGT
jgi:murein DD-endopeptidase MepM/ murein hydrolase activator NlpD